MELKMLIKECGFFDDNEKKEEDDDFDDKDYSNLDVLSSHKVYVLIINDIIDLNNHVFTREQGEYNNNYNASDDDDEVFEVLDEELDFKLIDRISASINM